MTTPRLAAALEAGIVRNEIRRVSIFLWVLGIFLVLLLGFIFLPGVFGSAVAPEVRDRLQAGAPLVAGIVFLMVVYEWGVRFWLKRLAARGQSPGFALRLLNATLEVTWVGILLFLSAEYFGALQSVVGTIPFLFFPILALSALNLDFRLSAWAGFVAAAGYLAVCQFTGVYAVHVPDFPMLTSQHQFRFRALLLLIGGISAGFVGLSLRRQLTATLESEDQHDRAVAVFGQHVSPQVAETLLNQPSRLSGEERDVCVMFLDIRDFSVFAGKKSATEVMDFLNLLFSGLIRGVSEHGGIVNKFLGDGFMAVFGAPVDDPSACRNAVRCGHALLAEARRLSECGDIAGTRLGIGLHFGPAVTGNVGSEERKEYTVIGDTVNLAARIEQATKMFHCELLVSEAVWRQLGPDLQVGDDLGPVELKGQAAATRLFKLV